ncbi:MAG: site-2 protease family protein [Terracidiphilus sp.]|jgi:Zn-dependent protease
MPFLRQGSIHLGRVAGIDLYLHWSWFVVAVIEIGSREGRYSTLVWSALEYLALFAIVLLHEFGHALACRQVGGTVDRIMLWPLGGVAFVNPPKRPGATLWSLAAGPLVNVALLPVFGAAYLVAGALGWANSMPNAYTLLEWILGIDIGLFVFNILPIYPLDGGQILRSLLWFFIGPARSLYAATVVGFVGAAGLVCLALKFRSTWSLLIAAYMLLTCWGGFKSARAMVLLEKLPRREGFACPGCGAHPPIGPLWKCAQCSRNFDTFEFSAVCPYCGAQFPNTMCGECQKMSPITEWAAANAKQSAAVSGSLANR